MPQETDARAADDPLIDRAGRNGAPGRTEPPLFLFQPLRPRILESVQSATGLSAKVLAIVAPVGYGKTVLMSLLLADLRRTGKLCVWLGLDDRDTAVDGVVRSLEAMLRSGHEERLAPAQGLFLGEEPMERRIGALVDFLNQHPMPVTVFIDNFNCCTDPTLGRLLDALAFRTRASVQLVLSSAHEISLDLSRAQLAGLLRQIGPSEMAFDGGEVAELLGDDLVTAIGRHGVDEVTRQTEGWPAAVRLAQIVLGNADDPRAALRSFSGSDEGIAHLLNRQVLSGFPPAVRDFLLRIAPLRTFCLELCVEATGSAQARDHLDYLLERNVFVIPLGRNRDWYRLHGLFREHLLREAARALDARQRQDVLMRAALWCEAHGVWRDSIDYALASGSTAIAIKIMEHTAPVFVRDRGDLAQYIRWVENLHQLGHSAGPETEYWFAWALTFHRRYETAREHCAELAERMELRPRHNGETGSAALRRRVAILRASIDALTDHLQDAHEGAARWLAEAAAGRDDPFNLTAAHCIECGYYANALRFIEAHRSIQAARECAFQARSSHVDGWVQVYAGLLAIREGDYAAAFPEIATTLASVRAALGDESGICGTIALTGAKCSVEMGLREDARQLLEFGLRTMRTHGFLEAVGCGLDAAVALWDGDPAAVTSLRDVAGCYPPRLSLMLSCWLVRRLLRIGRTDEALAEAARVGLGDGGRAPRTQAAARAGAAFVDALVTATHIDLLVATGRLKQAAAAVADEQRQAKAGAGAARLVELALAAATIAVRSDQHAGAVRHIMRAVSIAAVRRIVRPFDDQAATFAATVGTTRAGAWGFASEEERRFFGELCRKLAPGTMPQPARGPTTGDTVHLLGQPTARELELLAFIDAGLSNQQMADRIDVSLTTIKWHLQNLYSKLDVSSRSAALARARALNLLPR